MSPLPQPIADPDTVAYWTGGEQGLLLISRCGDCRRWLHPPVPVCRHCLSTTVTPEPVSGAGVVLTHTVNRQQWTPDMDVPSVFAVVELDEQPDLRLMTRLVDVSPEEVEIGMRVQVRFERSGDVWLPLFAPVAS